VGLGLAVGLGTAGCDRAGINVYQAPKEAGAQEPTPKVTLHETSDEAPAALHWTLPSGWEELPPGQMRVGHFVAKGADGAQAQITIIPLSGQGGGDVDNVNRWRGQIGLPRLREAEIEPPAERVDLADASGRLFDLAGKAPDGGRPTRLVAAMLHRQGTAWFFKMTGDDALVAAQKPVFVAFLKGLHFGEGTSSPHPETGSGMAMAPAAMPVAPAPPAAPVPAVPAAPAALTAPAASAGPAAPRANKPGWTVPSAWVEQAPGPMQAAKFSVAAEARTAEITVSVLPGDAGGRLPNINRWRGQIGLSPGTEADLGPSIVSLEIPGAAAYAVDVTGASNQRRLIAAAVSIGGQTWFYKLMGDDGLVGGEKEAFLKFVQSADYKN